MGQTTHLPSGSGAQRRLRGRRPAMTGLRTTPPGTGAFDYSQSRQWLRWQFSSTSLGFLLRHGSCLPALSGAWDLNADGIEALARMLGDTRDVSGQASFGAHALMNELFRHANR